MFLEVFTCLIIDFLLTLGVITGSTHRPLLSPPSNRSTAQCELQIDSSGACPTQAAGHACTAPLASSHSSTSSHFAPHWTMPPAQLPPSPREPQLPVLCHPATKHAMPHGPFSLQIPWFSGYWSLHWQWNLGVFHLYHYPTSPQVVQPAWWLLKILAAEIIIYRRCPRWGNLL